MTTLFNAARPDRPDYDGDIRLLYRTQPKKQKKLPTFFSIRQIVASIRLYRAARNGDIPCRVAIGELYDFVFWTEELRSLVSKKTMGNSIIHSVLHEPRILRNVRHEQAQMTYNFNSPKELEYGLEWHLSAVLYKWLDANGDWPKDRAEWQPRMQEELDLLVTSDDTENFLMEDAAELIFMEPNWKQIASTYPERRPPLIEKPAPVLKRAKPRDLSRF